MRKQLLISSFLLGIVFDLLFWKKIPGISFAIFITLCILTGYLLLRMQSIKPSRLTLLLLIPIIFYSVMTFNRLDPFTLLLNYSLALFCMAIFVMTYRSGQWILFGFGDYFINLFRLVASIFRFGWVEIFNTGTPQRSNKGKGNQNLIWQILRGLLLAVPILFIFGALFSSADLVFAQKINALLANLSLQNLGETILRGCVIFIVAYSLIGIFSHAASQSQSKKQIGKDENSLKPFLGSTEGFVVLGSILSLFSAFLVIQFQYFFAGQVNIGQTGFTYSEYARRGFGELVAVAAFSLIIFLSLSIITKRETIQLKRIFSGLGIGLVAQVIIILISSFTRLYLYESAYGFSRLRAYSHVFIIWLGILLVAVVVLEVRNHLRVFATVALIILMGFAASLNILNIDAFIAHENIKRAIQTQSLDTIYLSTLSNDAVPTIVKDYSSASLTPELKNEIAASLACTNEQLNFRITRSQSWQSFHFSDWNASRAIDTLQEIIQKYRVQKDAQSIIVIGPNGTRFVCAD